MMTKDEKTYLIKFGLALRRMREKRGWTLEYTEERGWKAWQYLQRIERGKQNPSLITLRKLAKLYGVPVKKLFE